MGHGCCETGFQKSRNLLTKEKDIALLKEYNDELMTVACLALFHDLSSLETLIFSSVTIEASKKDIYIVLLRTITSQLI
jgi:hypothetical protein